MAVYVEPLNAKQATNKQTNKQPKNKIKQNENKNKSNQENAGKKGKKHPNPLP